MCKPFQVHPPEKNLASQFDISKSFYLKKYSCVGEVSSNWQIVEIFLRTLYQVTFSVLCHGLTNAYGCLV